MWISSAPLVGWKVEAVLEMVVVVAPRLVEGVLNLAAEKSGWGKPLPKGLARGIAVHKSFGTWVAQVAEVRVNDNGSFRVERVVCAVDCGIATPHHQDPKPGWGSSGQDGYAMARKADLQTW